MYYIHMYYVRAPFWDAYMHYVLGPEGALVFIQDCMYELQLEFP